MNPSTCEMGSSETMRQSESKQSNYSIEMPASATSKPQYNHTRLSASPEDTNHNHSTNVDGEAYHLSWKEFPSKVVSFFRELQEEEEFVDVTLACEGKQIYAHKVVLAASSPFFRKLFKNNPCQHPIVILNDVRYGELKPLLHYMYHGQVQIEYDQISEFLRTAKLLQVKGLTGENHPQPFKRISETRVPPNETPEQIKQEEKIKRDSKSPEDKITNSNESPVSKRRRLSNSYPSHEESSGSRDASPASPVNRTDSTIPVISPAPVLGLPTSLPVLPPIPGLSLPLSMPSTITSLPPATAMHTGLSSHGSHPVQPSGPFPQFFGQHSSNPFQIPNSEDTSDTCASDKSEERPRPEGEDDEPESSLDKMSSLANMAALKGLAGFPGPSSLMGLAASAGMVPNSEHTAGRPRFDFYRVRATDPRPCHLCGKIYKNAHTLRTHMEDKHSNCNGFRCVLCGTVAKSRNSLHSHMSRQHRGISTKDLPLLPMPAPWNPEMASKYIQIVGGVGEVVRQNYRRCERDSTNTEGGALGSDASTPTSQENGTISPYLKTELDKERRPYDFPHQMDLSNYANKPAASSLLDTYLQMMRASGMDLMHNMNEKMWEDLRQNVPAARGGVLDLTRGTSTPSKYDDEERGSDQYSDDDPMVKANGRDRPIVSMSRSPPPSNTEDESKWAVP